MFCESCGKNIPDESRFCEYCGSEVIPESVIYSQEDIDNNIHSEQESASYNKQKRGSRYDQEIEKEYEYPRTPKPKKSGLIKKAAAFLVLAVVLKQSSYQLLPPPPPEPPPELPPLTLESPLWFLEAKSDEIIFISLSKPLAKLTMLKPAWMPWVSYQPGGSFMIESKFFAHLSVRPKTIAKGNIL
jgi:hypothetical protein